MHQSRMLASSLSIALCFFFLLGNARAQTSTPDALEKQINQAMQLYDDGNSAEALRKLGQVERAKRSAVATARDAIFKLRLELIAGIIHRKRAQIYLQSEEGQKSFSSEAINGRKQLISAEAAFKQAASQGDEFASDIESRITNDAALERNQSWRQALAVVSRAEYNLAWIAYELGTLEKDNKKKRSRLKNAIESFSTITSLGYPAKPDAIRCEAILGQAMVHFELGEFYAIIKLLSPATPDNTPPGLFKRMSWLLMKAHQAEPSYLKVENAAKAYFDTLKAEHQYDNIDLQMMLTRAQSLASLSNPEANPTYYRVFQKRLNSLSNQFQKFDPKWQKQFNDIITKSNTQTTLSQLSAAQEAFNKQNYLQAIDFAVEGLKLPNNQKSQRADFRYVLSLAYWNLEKWDKAYENAYAFIVLQPRDNRAAKLATLTYQAALKNREANGSPDAKQLIKVMDFIEANYKNLPIVKTFPLQRAAAYRDAKAYQLAIQTYQTIDSKNEQYLRSRYGIMLTAYDAMKVSEEEKTKQRWLATLINTGAAYVTQVQIDTKAGDKNQHAAYLQLTVIAGREALALATDSQLQALQLLLTRIGLNPILKSVNVKARQALLLQIKARRSAPSELVDLFNALVDDAPIADPYIAQSILAITDIFEAESAKAIQERKNREATLWNKLLVKAYIHLFKHVDADEKDDKQARKLPIHHRLGDTFVRLNDYKNAAKAYQWVLANMPKNQGGDVMIKLAKAYEKIGQIDEAIDLYKRLGKGLRKASDPWYEARYHWIKAEAARGDQTQAKKLLQWFKLQHPKVESPKWAKAFDQLERELQQTE